MDRRAFVSGLAAAAGVRAAASGERYAGGRPSPGHGARANRAPHAAFAPLGLQLYTVRREMQADVDGTLARVAEMGYREVEFWQYYGRTPAQISATLAANRLAAPSCHVGLETLEGDAAAATIAAAQAIGHRYLVVAWTPPAWRRTLADWRALAARFNRAGERLRAAGLALGYHNHDFELRPLEGRAPLDLFFEETDPALVKIQVDLYWMVHGGRDPLPFLRRWAGRVVSVHVKDRTADGRMVDVGAGAMDWRALLGAARQAGAAHFYVEHDEPAPDGLASARASYGYLAALEP